MTFGGRTFRSGEWGVTRPVARECLGLGVTEIARTRCELLDWIHIGRTSGRGRMDRENKAQGRAVKDIYFYPLVRDVRQRLRGDPIAVNRYLGT